MLEPIEEGDLDLKKKFIEGSASVEKSAMPSVPKNDLEIKLAPELELSKMPNIAPTPEAVERKEGQMEKDDTYAKILAKVQSPVAAVQSDVTLDAKIANDEADYESKLTKLVEMAEAKGIVHAVKVAQHMEENYLLDELHDRLLATDLHDALVKKGMITEA
ncbi:MAG: hypothetical protein WC848_04195 [Parcubacteria group bacterium]|jgi:hypothetical protein